MNSVLDNIGMTPMVRINKLAQGLECELLAKCEFYNAGGSVKDRVGKRMLEEAEKSGRIKPGDTLIEPTSGNTGIGMALAALVKGYRMVITLPEKMSDEKMDMLKALGAEIIRTPTEAAWDSPESHIGVAARLLKEIPNSHILDQYKNVDNPMAHYEGTAEEILWQCDGKLDVLVASAGTGGTISGLARKLKERIPDLTVIGVDPIGSILAQPEELNTPGPSYHVEGIGYDFIPDVLDRSLVDRWVKSSDHTSLNMSRSIIRHEGLLVGGSSGAAMAAALDVAKTLGKGQRVVVVLPDSTRNYMSKFLSDEWMVEHGFAPPAILTDPGTLGSKKASEWWEDRTVVELDLSKPMTISPSMACKDAIEIMRLHGFDQLPVVGAMEGIMGVASLANLTASILAKRVTPEDKVSNVMYTAFCQVPMTTRLAELNRIFKKHAYCLVTSTQRTWFSSSKFEDKTIVAGVCSRIDLLNFVVQSGRGMETKEGHVPKAVVSAPQSPALKAAGGVMHVRESQMPCQEYMWSFMKDAKSPIATPDLNPIEHSEHGRTQMSDVAPPPIPAI